MTSPSTTKAIFEKKKHKKTTNVPIHSQILFIKTYAANRDLA
jgi:hypothetical protein